MTLNNWTVIGNLPRDAELRYTASGVASLSFGVAVGYKPKDKPEQTEWVNCVWFGTRAEKISDMGALVKGAKVYVAGRHETRKWEDDQGAKHERVSLVVNELELLTPRNGNNRINQGQGGVTTGYSVSKLTQTAAQMFPKHDPLDDLPFD